MNLRDDKRFMALALSLGRRGLGRTAPNPAVGCVIVKDGRILGRGWTQPTGRPHAEVMALSQAGEAARGATVYVTLEPCAHHGKTPPCAEALIAAGVTRVVFACNDPDPRVAGKGAAMLRAADIDVAMGVLEQDARADHAGFLSRIVDKRPMLTLKLAMTVDGRIATGAGESQWITGPAARRHVHAERARHDAVMVGAGTARADNPMLNVRGLGVAYQPARVVVSRRLDVPLDGHLAQSAAEVPVILCHGPDAPEDARSKWLARGAHLVACSLNGAHLDARSVLQGLAGHGMTRVFCEGGGALAASLLEAGLVDRMMVFSAGFAIGAEGLPGVGALGLERLSDAHRFKLEDVRGVGNDVLQVWTKK